MQDGELLPGMKKKPENLLAETAQNGDLPFAGEV